MSKYDNDYYYQKYLKYKNKYLELKEYEGGGWLIPDSGIYIYFCNNKYVDNICKAINEKTISSYNINKILYDKGDNIVFKGKHGSNVLTQITKSTSESIKDKAAEGANFLAKKTAEGTNFLAKKTAEGKNFLAKKTAEGTNFLAKKTAEGARRVMDRNKDINTIVFTTGGGEGGGKVKVIKLTDNDENPIKLDIAKTNDLKKVVMYLRTMYNPNIDSIVIITYSPMGKNICNQKITWTDEELEQKSGINMNLTDTPDPASLARVDTYTGPLLQDNNPLSLKRAQTLKPFPPDKPQLQRKKTM